jgi:ABC-type multidrug transport system ATPase subunit
MPQDTSLVGEFTVRDAFYYFGRINGLDDEEIGRIPIRWIGKEIG